MKKFLYGAATMSLLFSNIYSMNKYNGLSTESALEEWEDEDLTYQYKKSHHKSPKYKKARRETIVKAWQNYLDVLLNLQSHVTNNECFPTNPCEDDSWCQICHVLIT